MVFKLTAQQFINFLYQFVTLTPQQQNRCIAGFEMQYKTKGHFKAVCDLLGIKFIGDEVKHG